MLRKAFMASALLLSPLVVVNTSFAQGGCNESLAECFERCEDLDEWVCEPECCDCIQGPPNCDP